MKKLIVDMDDVICEKGFIRMINEFLNSNYKQKDAHSYYINDLIPKEAFPDWLNYFEHRNVYDYMSLVDGAVETLKKLNEKYDVYIVTAYVFRDDPKMSGKQLKCKYDYLYENLPFINPKKFIFTSDKSMVKADIRIDDSVKKLLGDAEKKLLFTAFHNTDLTDEELEKLNIKRVNSWKEIAEELL